MKMRVTIFLFAIVAMMGCQKEVNPNYILFKSLDPIEYKIHSNTTDTLNVDLRPELVADFERSVVFGVKEDGTGLCEFMEKEVFIYPGDSLITNKLIIKSDMIKKDTVITLSMRMKWDEAFSANSIKLTLIK